MKKYILIITLFISFLNSVYAADVKTVTKEYKTVANDGFTIVANLEYPKIKEKTEFSTVVLLHSLGYSSQWWESLPGELIEKGYAVLLIDLRGHGKSIYNSNLTRVSWKNLTKKAYAKYPDDVLTMIDYVKNENKRIFFNNWAIVGADIGASTAVHVANKISVKPKTIVMLSPAVNAKDLYVPIKLAELNDIDILSIIGATDINGEKTNAYLKKFAQSTFAEYKSESVSAGMLMLKKDTTLPNFIAAWIKDYLK